LVDLTLPDPTSPDYTPTLIYQARAHIALSSPSSALTLLSSSASHINTENVAIKAVDALAKYVNEPEESTLEELRDLCVEIEGEDVEGDEKDKWLVRVLAGTAFARAGEVEEALETLQAGSNKVNLEA
jgi:coatomer subunit epsilon